MQIQRRRVSCPSSKQCCCICGKEQSNLGLEKETILCKIALALQVLVCNKICTQKLDLFHLLETHK